MSYDFYIEMDAGGAEPLGLDTYVWPEGIEVPEHLRGFDLGDQPGGNYTTNASPIWARCLTAALHTVPAASVWCGDDTRRDIERYGPIVTYVDGSSRERVPETAELCLRDLSGKECRALISVLAAAVAWGVGHSDELRELEPANGWGNAEGALAYLAAIEAYCRAYPLATLRISS